MPEKGGEYISKALRRAKHQPARPHAASSKATSVRGWVIPEAQAEQAGEPSPTPTRAPRHPGPTARIGPSIVIDGDISGEETLIITGTVLGRIKLHGSELAILESGYVEADVSASVVIVGGEVHGNVSGVEQVVISKGGRMTGDIHAPRVVLEDGAVFTGSIDMEPQATARTPVADRAGGVSDT